MAKDKLPTERQMFYFQFVTTPTADTSGTTLIVHFNSQRYLFGRVSEGTQRACIQQGVGIKKVRNIFLTGPTTWNNMGGLIGMILTMADVQSEERDEASGKRPKLGIHGGPKLYHAIACARRFVFRTGMPLDIFEARLKDSRPISEPQYVDENVNVWSLPITRGNGVRNGPTPHNNGRTSPRIVEQEQELRKKTVTDMFDSDWRKDRLIESRFDEVKLPAMIWTRHPETKELSEIRCLTMEDAPHLASDSKVLVRNPWPAALVGELPPADNLANAVAMSYIVKGHSQRGNFLPQKAKDLGVKPGPLYALLAAGQSITLDNGTVVTPDMVLTPAEPGKGMAILDVPTVGHLDQLANKINELNHREVMVGVEIASWLLGPDVFYSPKFRDMVASLPDIKHFIASPDTNANYLTFDSSAMSLLRLSQIRPECFLEPIHSNQVPETHRRDSGLKEIDFLPIERGLVAQLQPKVSIQTDQIPAMLDVQTARSSIEKSLEELIPAPVHQESSTVYDDIEIITLGTGSAVPSKYRNVSASLLRIPGLGNHLIDCGEGTLGQLRRAYKPDELDDILCDLRMIWISHLHADHHLGTMSVILARNEVLKKRGIENLNMYLISEPNMGDFIIDYGSIQTTNNCILLACLNSTITYEGKPSSIRQTSLPIKEFATTKVSHCHGAQAVSITFNNGFKFSYSGDCRPSANFAKIGVDSDVLLHEATFDDGMEGDAMAKKHSTTGEALGVAVQMRAKHVILTHFSQRYQKIPMLDHIKFAEDIQFEEGDDLDDNVVANTGEDHSGIAMVDSGSAQSKTNTKTKSGLVEAAAQLHICVAFDLMRVKVHQIRDMHRYYPAIERMFEIELAKSEAKREEAAAINGQRSDNKKKKNNLKWQEDNKNKNNDQKVLNGATDSKKNIYEKINRSKGSRNAKVENGKESEIPDGKTNGAISSLDEAGQTQQPLAVETAAPAHLSSKARRRLQNIQDRKQARLLHRQNLNPDKKDDKADLSGNIDASASSSIPPNELHHSLSSSLPDGGRDGDGDGDGSKDEETHVAKRRKMDLQGDASV